MKFLPTPRPASSDVHVPALNRQKCEQLIEMFCAGGEFELARRLANYADKLGA